MAEQLFDAAFGELGAVARGQPCMLVGDFNVEPTKIPCLAKGISAGLWVDFEEAWALAAGLRPASTCKSSWGAAGGHRSDFMVGVGGFEDCFRSCVPGSVFGAGSGRGSVEAWYTAALRRCFLVLLTLMFIFSWLMLSSPLTLLIGVFLDRVLSSLGLPSWFRHAYFEYHAHVRLRFKLASGLGEPWTRDGGISQGCPLSMMFIFALYLPLCRYLAAQEGVGGLSSLKTRDLGGHLDTTFRG